MCHAASWIINNSKNPPHGKWFWQWADLANKKIPEITVTRCHAYVIHRPYKFECININCKQIYSRHSKKGIDILRFKYIYTSMRHFNTIVP